VDAGQLRSHIDEAVRSSVEERLNGLLDAEAERICGAERYERSPTEWTHVPGITCGSWRLKPDL
jgi:transposase-like protein